MKRSSRWRRVGCIAFLLSIHLTGGPVFARQAASFERLAPEIERISLFATAASEDLKTIVGWGQRTATAPVGAFVWTDAVGFQWIDPGDPDVQDPAVHGNINLGALFQIPAEGAE